MTILSLQRNLRKNMTQPEILLWRKIRGKQLGIKFRRQYAVLFNPNLGNPIPTFPLERGRRLHLSSEQLMKPSRGSRLHLNSEQKRKPSLSSSPFLRERLGEGLRFRILDFYSAEAHLGIEIDGESHFTDIVKRFYDLKSDQIIFQQQGIKILRFLNTDISQNPEGVIEKISNYINKN